MLRVIIYAMPEEVVDYYLRRRWPLAYAEPVGAAVAANTGAAGAMQRVACFAGLPAPTEGLRWCLVFCKRSMNPTFKALT
ncbi:hypothetical protein [Pseudomonas sp. AFG_SD02_1510_Pfu_092]|uniref:hypothetical protein n=1 Tax=Pseudomonas sp. AFG_SD02_1510_Pfu_092 TaxID=2259497 RepID=UPI00137A06CE|nr:hypothetical protein [Pseudomonas sp. AFG_SD02_1510_Pfu_092]